MIRITNYLKKVLLLFAGVLFLSTCQKESPKTPVSDQQELSIAISHFPPMDLEPDKALTPARIALGKKLFFDPILSRNQDLSCASCHLPELAFSDGLKVSVGDEGRTHFRNSPSLFNVAWQPYLFMDGGNPTLESQVIGPIEEFREMNIPFPHAMARVAADSDYQAEFQAAFGDDVNPYTLTLALATFQRTLVSYDSPFDRFYYQGDSSALTTSAQRGLELFTSARLSCEDCHKFPLTTDFSFQNNGLYEEYPEDPGRARVTNNRPEHEGQFKVATLRNIALTAPYMHDGSISTLEEVIDHYASGGSSHRLKSEKITGFSLSSQEKQDLVAFLESLTDTSSYKQYVR